MFGNYNFENPEFLWLLVLVPLLILWIFWTRKQTSASLRISTISGFDENDSIIQLYQFSKMLPILAFTSLIIALARPQSVKESTEVKSINGIDIVMAVDVSASMLAKDLKPNRLNALKKVAAEFIKERVNDRIGLVLYSGESYTKTPVTSDKSIVIGELSRVEYDQRLEGGTAIGMGLATAINRIKESKAKSKVIILLTDGVNNSGFIEPLTAAELAVDYGIKVYTIAIGTRGRASSPVAMYPNGKMQFAKIPVEIDEKLLKSIAKITGGKYFRATDNRKLEVIYNEIDQLEKTELEELKFTQVSEKYHLFALIAFICIALQLSLIHI